MDTRDYYFIDNNFYHINKSLISLNSTIVDINQKVEIILGISLFLGIVTLSAILTVFAECIRTCRSSNTHSIQNFQ